MMSVQLNIVSDTKAACFIDYKFNKYIVVHEVHYHTLANTRLGYVMSNNQSNATDSEA